jgi:multisubunit Na+/H+ antiporter MnhB subunit
VSSAIDVLVAAGLIWLASQTVRGPSLFRSIILFIVFGLFMALAWARLGVQDLALAEAAIGAGLTGALLLGTYRRLYRQVPVQKPPSLRTPSRLALPISLLAAILVAAIGAGALTLEPEAARAGSMALQQSATVGLENPVTAVLLSFRGWDTLLELVVLLAAFLGSRAIALDDDAAAAAPERSTMVDALLSMVVPLTVIVGIYLLRVGGFAPGGAFQGGAVLAAGGVLLVLSGRLQPVEQPGRIAALLLTAGILTFAVFGVASLVCCEVLLGLPGPWAVYVVETAMAVSIAVTLLLLFAGGAGLRRGNR